MKMRSRTKVILIIALTLAVSLAAVSVIRLKELNDSERRASDIVEVMKGIVPGLGSGEPSSGMGRDPLPAMSID